ncbi:MAG: GatB/YqeY domain-containing protein, partial [Ignavibacteria bacterium]|nr:GatB/YqeY domain-containing protein [Ignavibacteria bacterium]
RKESIEQYKNAGRTDLSDKEEVELKIIEEYLPKQLTVEEILTEVKKIADEVGAKTKEDFPKVMPLAAKNLKGKADGKVIREILEKLLSGN